MTAPSAQPHPDLVELVDALAGFYEEYETGRVYFNSGRISIVGTLDEVTSALFVRARIGSPADKDVVDEWLDRQPDPVSGVVSCAEIDYGDGRIEYEPVMAFERPSGHDWVADPMLAEIDEYHRAWEVDEGAVPVESGKGWTVPQDPRNQPPESAWLVLGSEASYPSRNDLAEADAGARVGFFDGNWTASSTTRRGDLLLFYFTTPRKAVHFVARSASDGYFRRADESDADAHFNVTQWWADITPMIEIEPIPIDRLREVAGGLILNSGSGIFLDPWAIAALDIRAADPGRQAEVDRIAATPIGLADLPSPETMTFEQWREIASGALKLEAHVSSHIVEPLLRWLIADRGLTIAREYKIGKRLADFVVLDGEGRPVHVIEVKKRIRSTPRQSWEENPDFAQVRWYADHLGVAATLIDAQRLLLVDHLGEEPTRILTRRELETADLADLRAHVLGPSATVRYRIFNVMDRSQTTFATIETGSDGVVRSYARDDGRATDVFQAEIRAGLTLDQVKGSFRNYAFVPEG